MTKEDIDLKGESTIIFLNSSIKLSSRSIDYCSFQSSAEKLHFQRVAVTTNVKASEYAENE